MNKRHLLFFEPRIEGHHLMFLQHVVEALLEADWNITLAIDQRTDHASTVLHEKNPDLMAHTRQINAYDSSDKFHNGSELTALARCLQASGAESSFVNSLDGFISSTLRKAAFGLRPPSCLHGRIGGIYERPRWFSSEFGGVNQWLKKQGFLKLSNEGWFTRICLLNEFFAEDMPAQFPGSDFHFLPTPGPLITTPQQTARQKLGLPKNAIILLNYGVGHRRKGLHLVTTALNRIDNPELFLLCAGRQNRDLDTLNETLKLEKQGRAKILNRYISDEEEGLCFRAADYILVPYLSHFGNSNILAQAVLAGRPVIASDFDLIGRRVRERKLGILFNDRSLDSLTRQLRLLDIANEAGRHEFDAAIKLYAEELSIESFRSALNVAYPKL